MADDDTDDEQADEGLPADVAPDSADDGSMSNPVTMADADWIAGDFANGQGLLGLRPSADPVSAATPAPFTPDPVPIILPGMGADYIDGSVRDRAYQFVNNMIQKGLRPNFDSAYRSPQRQAEIRKTTPNAASQSLHGIGTALDLQHGWWMSLSQAQKQQVVDAAGQAGWSWGGNFRVNAGKEQNHFYIDPYAGDLAARKAAIGQTDQVFKNAGIDTRTHAYKPLQP